MRGAMVGVGIALLLIASTSAGGPGRFRTVGVQRALGRDPRGRWRDVVLLERRSAAGRSG